ncbi:MAG: hypothetical protein HYX43_10550 [Burkholderiales bacterium]|nr:hypothetical protein [Burkholderiales bacterium]
MSDATIERLKYGATAAGIYETQLRHAAEALSTALSAGDKAQITEAREALQVASEKGLELQRWLPGRILTADLMLPMGLVCELMQLQVEQSLFIVKEKLVEMHGKVTEHLAAVSALRDSLEDELRAARADVLKPRQITAYDIARAAEQQQAESEAAARDLLRKLPASTLWSA